MKINIKVRHLLIMLLSILLILVLSLTVNAQKYNMTYLYGSGNYISMINETKGALNEVSPSYFDIDSKGNLILNTVDMALVNEMHSEGIKVVPFLSNHWDRELGRIALKNRETLSTQIVNAVINYNLDGVNVDIENVTDNDRNSYTDLVRLLRNKLPSDKSLVVSVAANPYNWQEGWHGSYDYTALASYADYIMIMAYDEHFEGGDAGPVAGINFVEKSIKYALERVGKNKIVLGIPLYGRYWKNGSSYGGKAVSLEQMNEIVQNYPSTVTYDKESESVKAVVTIKQSVSKPKIYGQTLSSGTYTFWYENEESIKAKLELVNRYDIKGAGTWRLGLEQKSIWDIFKQYLFEEERIFSDVPNEHWAKEAIFYMKEKTWINGRTKDLYMPESYITRAEVATIVCRILNYDLSTSNTKYDDTKGHWAEKYINTITEYEIVNGYAGGKFKPDNYITRAEVAKIFKNLSLEKEKIANYTVFIDVDSKHWAYSYIKELNEKRIINGYLDNTFRPDNNVTRAEIAKMIYEIYK